MNSRDNKIIEYINGLVLSGYCICVGTCTIGSGIALYVYDNNVHNLGVFSVVGGIFGSMCCLVGGIGGVATILRRSINRLWKHLLFGVSDIKSFGRCFHFL